MTAINVLLPPRNQDIALPHTMILASSKIKLVKKSDSLLKGHLHVMVMSALKIDASTDHV